MRNYFLNFFLSIFCLGNAVAQNTDSVANIYGIRQNWGGILLSRSLYPEIHGRVRNYKWKDIETSNNVWRWKDFDKDIKNNEDGVPVTLMIFTKEDSPDWLYTRAGVPKVIEYNSNNDSVGFSPYYADPTYKFYFERMIDSVANHIKAFPESVKKWLSIQGCLGEEGDYIGYRNSDGANTNGSDTGAMHVDSIYELNREQLAFLFKEYTWHYYNQYVGTNIRFMTNPSSASSETRSNIDWVIDSLPGAYLKYAVLGKGYQLNDEMDKIPWLMPDFNSKHNNVYMRSRSDLGYYDMNTGPWKIHPPRNMFALFTSMIYWGMDWSDQMPTSIKDSTFTAAYDFFNKYAGEKDTVTAAHAMCALRDALDASDPIRFPQGVYGVVSKTNAQRYINIQNKYSSKGALLNDVFHAMADENETSRATGINDVGWRMVPGNYDRYLHQINANGTSIGYWNVNASKDTNSIYGRFARGFDLANGKNALYFDADNGFLHNAPLNSQYAVMISVTYLDKGAGSWQLVYDAQDNSNKPSVAVTCKNSGQWKTASVTLRDAYFGNRGISGSDFRISSTNSENVIFALVELERPNAAVSNDGLFASALSPFDTSCINSTSVAKSFTLNGAFLNSSNVTVGPMSGFEFSLLSDSAYNDSLIISNYGTAFRRQVYVKFVPKTAGSYNRNIPVRGGGAASINVAAKAAAVNSSPVLSADITPVSCRNDKNGAIDLKTTGGILPFTYSWTGFGVHKAKTQDISGLSASTYTVEVSSYAGCMVSASYIIAKPDTLIVSLTSDSMLCRGGTTTVHVNATGGVTPYDGTGNFTVSGGRSVFTVTDAHGCSVSQAIIVNNGTGVSPDKPASILGEAADAKGLCGGGDFNYAVTTVATATSYAWKPPPGCTIQSASSDSTNITLRVPANFSTGTLSVTANNLCGSSGAQTKTLTDVPARPGAITGPITVHVLQTGLVYKVPPVAGLSYIWAVPAGAQIISGQNTATIKVTWGSIAGNVNAKAVNACGNSLNSILSVNLIGDPTLQQNARIDSLAMPESIMVLPNPAKNIASLLFISGDVNKYTVTLTDITGKLLMHTNGITVKGENTVNIDIRNYANGIYLVTLLNYRGEIKSIKLLKE